jgi:hypothetical protein
MFQRFLEQLVGGASERKETLHFVSAREMTNIILAACDGKDGNPGEYRDYRFRRLRDLPSVAGKTDSFAVEVNRSA